MGFFPPTPYPLEPCPFHSMLHCRSWLWFILFDVRIYMMSSYNVPHSMIDHRQLPLLPKHTRPNRWWGFFLELLTMINYIIYIMQTWSKPRCYIPLPLGITSSSMFQYRVIHIQYIYNCTSKFQNLADLSHVHLFTLNVQDQAPQLP